MLRRHARTAGTALAAAGLLLTTLQGVGAAAAPGSPGAAPASDAVKSAAAALAVDATTPAVLDAMRRDLGLTPTQARARLVNEAEAGAKAAVLRQRLAAAFAGAWLDGAESGTLTVATTRAADAALIRAAGARAGGGGPPHRPRPPPRAPGGPRRPD
ncbi:hypothetical protein ACWEQL_38910, partial [Kitasatospora sp. NPDC004240]